MKAYLLGMKSCSIHSDPFVRLFAISENVKILTQFHPFLIAVICSKSVFRLDDCRVLYIYITSVVDVLLNSSHKTYQVYAVLCFISSVICKWSSLPKRMTCYIWLISYWFFFAAESSLLAYNVEPKWENNMNLIIICVVPWSQQQS